MKRQRDNNADPLQKLSLLMPKFIRTPLLENMVYAQFNTKDYDRSIGTLVMLFFAISVIAAVVSFIFLHNILISLALIPGGFFIAFYMIRSLFSMMADSTSAKIEKVLPDMLLLMAANLRAGMIPETSFLASIKPEFGKLNSLLNQAAIEVQGGENFAEALSNMGLRTNSAFFRDTMRIISEGLRSGAELHTILENLANNLFQNESIRNDMKAQVKSYALFIFIASTIAAPLLYGVSSFLIGILDKVGSSATSTSSVPAASLGALGSFSSFSLPHISVTLILVVATVNVVITTASSALLNGILNTGKAKNGLKQLPLFIGIGLVIFLVVRLGVSIVFAGQLG